MISRANMNVKNVLLQFAHLLGLAVLVVVPGCGGCRQEHSQPATTAADTFDQRHQLDKLYLTQKTLKRVIRPGNVSVPFVDKETREFCWPALVCTNPTCPGQGQDGFPYLFIHSDPLVTVGANGEPVYPQVGPGQDYSKMVASAGGFPNPTCPACYEKFRHGQTETPEETNRYANYVKEYELPESAQRREDLQHGWKSPPAVVSASQNSAAAPQDASPAEEQRAVELANQITRPMLKGGVEPETTALLRQALKGSDDPQVRAAIVAGLGRARDPDCVPQLLDAMADESLEMRKLAGTALERTCGFPRLFQADAPLAQRQEVIARYQKIWDALLNTPGQPYIRMMKETGYKEEMGRRAMEKLKQYQGGPG